jgi:hypothetical protein
MSYIDPIKVHEERARLDAAESTMRAGAHAADALLWFAEFANAGPKQKPNFEAPLKVGATLSTASAVHGYSAAQSFVSAVAEEFAAEILGRAIAKAKAQYERAEAARQDISKAQRERL